MRIELQTLLPARKLWQLFSYFFHLYKSLFTENTVAPKEKKHNSASINTTFTIHISFTVSRFECLNLSTSFSAWRCIFRMSRPPSSFKVVELVSRSQQRKSGSAQVCAPLGHGFGHVTRLNLSVGPIRGPYIAYTRAMSEHRCFPKKRLSIHTMHFKWHHRNLSKNDHESLETNHEWRHAFIINTEK